MRNTGSPPSGEELVALQEQLAEARAEVERLQDDAANAEARATTAIGEAAALRSELAAAQQAHQAATTDAADARRYVDAAEQRLREAAERYREMVVRTEPELPAELIVGDDITEIDDAIITARDIVGRVRSYIESQAQSARVPAGAPPRRAPDHSALSPEEKIRVGLRQRTA